MTYIAVRVSIYMLLVFLIACSAFFSGSEIAVATANKIRLKNAADTGNKRAKLAQKIADNFTEFLSTVLVGNTLVNIAASSAATVLAVYYFGNRGQAIAPIVMTVIILIFGEILPKILATETADRAVLIFAPLLKMCTVVFKPIVFVVTKLVDKLSKLWTPPEQPSVTDEELVEIVDTIEEEGVISEREGELIRSAIVFSETTAHEILTPRVDVTAVDIDDPVEEILADEELMNHSRVPVYEDTIDNIIGILNTKQLLKAAIADKKPDIRRLMREPLFVHMTMTTADLLQEFRERRLHMAVVVDEYGGTMGILTLEDVLEEIVGDIWDEKDVIESDYTQDVDGAWIVDGLMQISELLELAELDDREFESEYTTVGGWATEMLDRFPEVGDSFSYQDLIITVTKTDNMRVDKLRVEKKEESAEDNEDAAVKE
jgi:CBS domain containing-hemolysin-like protein